MKTQSTQLKPLGARIASTSWGLLIRLNTYRAAVLALFFAGATLLGTSGASAATITVINTNDSGPGSLRQALVAANDGDTINFDSSLKRKKITLTSGQLNVNKGVTISGLGAKNLAVNGNGQSRVFYVNPGKTVTINGLTVKNGASDGGGGIYNYGTALTVSNCTISSNYGGGIYNWGATLTLSNCTISGNSGGGGGIYGFDSTLMVSNCTISSNSGGGISSGAGGGESGYSTVTVSNSTISGNSAVDGGAIYNSGVYRSLASLSIKNSTISGNSATGNGSGIYNRGYRGFAGSVEIGTTILNAGSSGVNIFNDGGTVTSLGYNLSSDNGGGYLIGLGDQINTAPLLGPLQANGGPTFTHALLPGSPAINKGNPNFTPPPFYDQRGQGFNRVVNGRIDVGSFEIQSAPAPTPTPTVTPTPTPTATSTPTPIPRPSAAPRPRP